MTAFAVRMPDLRKLFAELDANPLAPWVAGAFTLLTGLVMVALHLQWNSPAAVIVSVLGVLTTIKGIVLMTFPGIYAAASDAMVAGTGLFLAGAVIVGLIGLYLTYVGWVRHD